ncbi:MAG: phosphocholine cytidylyltransferase family protein [Lachnospiraceae bacterium]|nr:phosphocholine cytidylyltransferase family protein [Lachnospiraceae bacterium]
MKAILLAAGKGTRISRMVKAVPKSTLPINGVPLIRRTVDMLLEEGFEVVVCVGYQQEVIRDILKDKAVKYYYNPFYDVTNSIASLWFAQEELKSDEDVIILNADVYFSKQILKMLVEDKREVVLMVDKTRTATGDYFFATTDSGCVKEYGKELPLQKRKCEYVGMAKVQSVFIDKFKERMNELIGSQQHKLWWENVIYSFTDNNERDIFTKDVEGMFWSEIDYFDDYERILNHLSEIDGNLEE